MTEPGMGTREVGQAIPPPGRTPLSEQYRVIEGGTGETLLQQKFPPYCSFFESALVSVEIFGTGYQRMCIQTGRLPGDSVVYFFVVCQEGLTYRLRQLDHRVRLGHNSYKSMFLIISHNGII
jgi:hypothetical protein